jgi:hypothetical protein
MKLVVEVMTEAQEDESSSGGIKHKKDMTSHGRYSFCCLAMVINYHSLGDVYLACLIPSQILNCLTLLSKVLRLRVFENRVLRRIFGTKRDEVIRGWRKLIMSSFITCTLLQV